MGEEEKGGEEVGQEGREGREEEVVGDRRGRVTLDIRIGAVWTGRMRSGLAHGSPTRRSPSLSRRASQRPDQWTAEMKDLGWGWMVERLEPRMEVLETMVMLAAMGAVPEGLPTHSAGHWRRLTVMAQAGGSAERSVPSAPRLSRRRRWLGGRTMGCTSTAPIVVSGWMERG